MSGKDQNRKNRGRPFLESAEVKGTQVSVRLDGTTTERLDHINRYAGLGRAELIRRAIDEFLHNVEQAGKLTTEAEIPPFNERK